MTILVAGIVAVAIGVVTDLLTGWARSALRSAANLARGHVLRRGSVVDDHMTIHSGWIRVDGGHWPSFHVHVRCAPSLHWEAPCRMDRDGVYRFVHRVAPGVFPHEADYSVPDELIRFASASEPDGEIDQVFACATPTGVLEVSVALEHRDTDAGPIVPVAAIARTIGNFQAEIASGAFDRIYGASAPRVDWFLNLSPSIARGDFQQSEWVDIDFPGRRPGGRASGMRPPADVRGYGRTASQSVSTAAPIDDAARPLLTDFLERNGYHEIDGAVDDIIDTVRPSQTQRAAS